MHPVDKVAATSGGRWEFYEDDNGVKVVRMEIDSAAGSPQEDKMLRAEMHRLMKAACEGRLKPHLDVKQLWRNPLIFELRWNLGGDALVPRRLWRLYFGWEAQKGPLRLGLKFAEKPRGDHGAVVQDGHIDEASARYWAWFERRVTR